MAEIKNSFLRSKMNKDLDNRLIPNGEYRDAQNISVGKSESDNIGSLENVLGNNLLASGSAVPAGNVIGTYNDEPNELIYVFFTDNAIDSLVSTSINHYIVVIKADGTNFDSGSPWNILVQGKFLNFSANFPIVGINLIEDLLFFTDNRNQPRVINVTNSLGYYTQESDVSVAKFSPYEPIQLFKEVKTTSTSTQTSNVVAVAVATGIEIGMTLISTNSVGGAKIQANDYVLVTAINGLNITLTSSRAFINGDLLYFMSTTMTNQDSDATWPGDPNFLENKFVRFSYRYRYVDGEYSTFAPFTQPTYIPKQKGFFLNENEENAYRSTILAWMENSVQNVELLIPLPDIGNNINPDTSAPGTYKISELDILYKESNALVAKVLETIPYTTIRNNSPFTNLFSFNYQSSKPYKTLTEAQTIRVYDQIPVRALAQESAGNRIIYGNFYNKFSPPTSGIKYEVGVGNKRTTPDINNWIEYPNSSLKQNRNYQVGIVLADKWGRQSSVILSNVVTASRTINGVKFGASTIFSPYNDAIESATSPVKDWFGDTLQVYFEDPISTGDSSSVYISAPTELPNTTPIEIGSDPGLYAQAKGGNSGFNISGSTVVAFNQTQTTYTFTFTGSAIGVPLVNDYLRGEYTDYVKVTDISPTVASGAFPIAGTTYIITCDGAINKGSYSLSIPAADPDVKFAYDLNQTGWYSYKIVVKQQEQDYYNTFLPGVLNGYPDQIVSGTPPVPTPFPVDEINQTANIVLLNDNINKIPRDLQEVGPDQKQFSSSVQLFGRVQNTASSNVQFFPGTLSDTVVNIETADDSNMKPETLTDFGIENLYQVDTNPLIGRISTSKEIGVSTSTMVPHLAVYETEPVESLLDIYWESTSTGLISDLNADILGGFDGPVGFSAFTYTQSEITPQQNRATIVNEKLCSIDFKPQNDAGVDIDKILNNFSALDANGDSVSIELIRLTDPAVPNVYETATTGGTYTGPWNLRTTSLFTYDHTTGGTRFSPTEYYQFNFNFEGTSLNFRGNFTNVVPVINSNSLVDLPVSQGDSSVLRTLIGVNGGVDATKNTDSLFFNIQNQVDSNAATVTYFTLTSAGALTMDAANTPPGSYVLTIRLRDATDSSNNEINPGRLFDEQALNVIIGNTGLSLGCISPCIDPSTTGAFATNTVTATTYNTKYNACWYISDNTLISSATPASNDFEGTGFPGTNTSVSANNGVPWHLGVVNGGQSDQKIGTIVFNITLSQQKTQNNTNFVDSAVTSFNVYSRCSNCGSGGGPGNWAPAVDLNGFTFLGTTPSPDQLSMFLNNNVVNTYMYNQYIFAFDTPTTGGSTIDTEYAIVMVGLEISGDNGIPAAGEYPAVTVNSQDLYNDVCVLIPKSGTSAAINYGTLAATTPKSYRYAIGAPSNQTSGTPGGGTGGGVNGIGFAGTAYGEYAYPRFFSTLNLQTVSNWTTIGPGGVAFDSLNNSVYPWNVTDVVTSTNPTYTAVVDYKDYNFAAVMTSGGEINITGTSPWIYNYGNNSVTTGVTKPLLRKTGGQSG